VGSRNASLTAAGSADQGKKNSKAKRKSQFLVVSITALAADTDSLLKMTGTKLVPEVVIPIGTSGRGNSPPSVPAPPSLDIRRKQLKRATADMRTAKKQWVKSRKDTEQLYQEFIKAMTEKRDATNAYIKCITVDLLTLHECVGN